MRAPDFLCRPLVAVGCGSLVARSCFKAMIVSLPTDILKLPIADIPELSKKFRACCQVCGFHTLRDVCDLGAVEASKIRYLGPGHFRELVDFLQQRRLLHALKD